jgi:predicted nucleic acid-binding protein
MKVGLDSNVLIYAEALNGADRQVAAHAVLNLLRRANAQIVIPAQVLGETFAVLVRKGGLTRPAARDVVSQWRAIGVCPATTDAAMLSATTLAAEHQLGIWDSVILAVSASARCELLLSQDMQDGFSWSGVSVLNPFHSLGAERLQARLEESASF